MHEPSTTPRCEPSGGESIQYRAPKSKTGSDHLWGIEVLRLLSAFGVIFRHVGLVVDSQTTVWGNAVQVCFKFGVQFFLITALFFAARRELRRLAPVANGTTPQATPDDTFGGFARTRFARVMVPFLVWGAIYIGARSLQLWHAGDSAGLRAQFADPGRLLLSGGAMMLYFLPQLWIGLLLLRAISASVARWNDTILLGVFALGVAAGFALDVSGNSYGLATTQGFGGLGRALGTATGFDPNSFLPTRLGLAVLAHAARALPLIALAFLIARGMSAATTPAFAHTNVSTVDAGARAPFARLLALGAAGWALTLLHPLVSPSLSTLSTLGGCGAFCAALWLSKRPLRIALPVGLGRLAFGTFLCHQITLYALAFTIGRLIPRPVGPAVLFILAVTAMALSLSVTAFAARTRLGRQIFAVA